MGTGVGLRQVGYVDCAGGGQVVVVDGIAYVGHMRSPHGTSIIDVRDPRTAASWPRSACRRARIRTRCGWPTA